MCVVEMSVASPFNPVSVYRINRMMAKNTFDAVCCISATHSTGHSLSISEYSVLRSFWLFSAGEQRFGVFSAPHLFHCSSYCSIIRSGDFGVARLFYSFAAFVAIVSPATFVVGETNNNQFPTALAVFFDCCWHVYSSLCVYTIALAHGCVNTKMEI